MKNFRVCLIGCGTIAPSHLTALSLVSGAKIVGLCDIKPEKAEAMKKRFAENAAVYTDYKIMLDTEKPDSVHIATPHYLHCEMAIYALSRNINVFLEKPMCISEDEIDKLKEAEKSSTAKICVCFQNRYNPTVLKLQELVRADGGALTAYGSVFWHRDEKYYTQSGWRGSYATEGGGVMINQAIHTIDLLCYILGIPKIVCATTANHHLKGIIEVEDSCEGLIKFQNGKQANFYATTSFLNKDCTTTVFITEKHKYTVDGQYLYCDGIPVEGIKRETEFVGKECYGSGHSYLIPLYYNCLENGTEAPVDIESASYAIKILLAAYRSCDKPVKL